VATTALVAAACGNSTDRGDSGLGGGRARSKDSAAPASNAPGVTADEIRVGGVASVTNPLGGKYADSFAGVKAYFDMVNADGGVAGRKLVLVSERDDKVVNNDAEVQGLLEQDDVFAVIPVTTLLFSGAKRLVDAGVPTFGWIISQDWQGSAEDPRPNLFGQNGSYLCFDCAGPLMPYVAKKAGKHKIGILAYNVPQSAGCAKGVQASVDRYGEAADAQVVFTDSSLSYGTTDLSVQVQKMTDAGVDLVTTCMDQQGVVTLAKELKKQGSDAIQFLPNGYDHELLDEFGDLFEGSYLYPGMAPLEMDDPPEAMETMRKAFDDAGVDPTENAIIGWINADLFVRGLREAGDDLSRQGVIDAINSMTDWNAGGLVADVDWTTAHRERAKQGCYAYLRIHDSEFEPVWGQPGKPFVCFDWDSTDLEPAAITG
jgi:branched-chain amino acid transport system substrate-binding protein